jgi:hypothetical protein
LEIHVVDGQEEICPGSREISTNPGLKLKLTADLTENTKNNENPIEKLENFTAFRERDKYNT